jgi:hypothetical protein
VNDTASSTPLARFGERTGPSRVVRASARATVAFGVFQFLALPLVISHDATGWQFHPETLGALSLTAVLAYTAFRRFSVGLVALGLWGVWRLFELTAFIVRILTGHAGSDGRAEFAALLVFDIPAVFWLIGAIAVIRVWRRS